MVNNLDVQMVLGGSWHDFDGFSSLLTPVLSAAGYSAQSTNDLDVLMRLPDVGCKVVLLFTCLDDKTTLNHTDDQLEALDQWVSAGGALLTVHSATVAARHFPALKSLIGGSFISHPPQTTFTVYPAALTHPILSGIDAFSVHDEFYRVNYDPSVHITLMGLDEKRAYPLGWTRQHDQGRVAYLSLGHDAGVWNLPIYQQLILQSLRWLTSVGAGQ